MCVLPNLLNTNHIPTALQAIHITSLWPKISGPSEQFGMWMIATHYEYQLTAVHTNPAVMTSVMVNTADSEHYTK